MKNLIFLTLIITFANCNKTDEMLPQPLQFNIDASVEFSILNSQNEDLLNPNTPNHIAESDIKIFYLINGKNIEVFDPSKTNPRKFYIFKHLNEYRIRISQNISETEEKPITYIQWNKNDTDTIQVTYNRTPAVIQQRKIWLNNKQIWDWTQDKEPFFIIRK